LSDIYVNMSAGAGGDGTTNGEGTGGTNAYDTLADAESALPATFTEDVTIHFDAGTGNFADTTGLTLNGYDPSTFFLTVRANTTTFTGENQWRGEKYDTGKARIEVAGSICVAVYAGNTRLRGFQIKNTRTGGTGAQRGIASLANFNDFIVDSLIIWNLNATTNATNEGVEFNLTHNDCVVVNTTVYDFTNAAGILFRGGAVYNNTVDNCDYGFQGAGGTTLAKNNLAFGNITGGYTTFGFDTTNSSNNAYSNGTAMGANAVDISAVTSGELFTDYADNIYRLGGTDASPVEAAGEDLNPDSDGNYDVIEDCLGNAQDVTNPSCGAFAKEVAVGGGIEILRRRYDMRRAA